MKAEVSGVTIECVRGDISSQSDVDAVVNAANAQLAPGGGVAGAIHRAGGPGLYDECKAMAPISTGEAVITGGHELPNPHCIHALGPVYGESPDPAGELASCYRGSLARAEEKGLGSIALPSISTGAFGYPMDEAAEVAIRTVAEEAPNLGSVRLVRFCLFGEDALRAHADALERVTGSLH